MQRKRQASIVGSMAQAQGAQARWIARRNASKQALEQIAVVAHNAVQLCRACPSKLNLIVVPTQP